MRMLHVAALPFPSAQGTQGLLHAMLSALARHGHETHLVCYAHQMFERTHDYQVHRAQNPLHDTSLTSGPSLKKVASDLALSRRLRALYRALRPDLVIAHHVEAALATMLAGISDWLFVAHTSLSAELAEYFPSRLRRGLCFAGQALDQFLCRSASKSFAVSPRLAMRLSRESGRAVHALTLPWFEPAPIAQVERALAKQSFGLSHDAKVTLYAGNLDPYQGLIPVAAASQQWLRAGNDRRLIVATNDAPGKLAESPFGALKDRVLVARLDSEAARRRVHAAADVVVVPRKSEGGVPVKMIDALSRGVPVIAAQRATAGFSLGVGCCVIADDSADAFHVALDTFFSQGPSERERLRQCALETFVATFRAPDFVRELTDGQVVVGR